VLSKLSKADYDELMDIWEYKVKRMYQSGRSEIATRIPRSVAKAIDRRNKFSLRRESRSKRLTDGILRFDSYVSLSP
jgi:hypothetical protein